MRVHPRRPARVLLTVVRRGRCGGRPGCSGQTPQCTPGEICGETGGLPGFCCDPYPAPMVSPGIPKLQRATDDARRRGCRRSARVLLGQVRRSRARERSRQRGSNRGVPTRRHLRPVQHTAIATTSRNVRRSAAHVSANNASGISRCTANASTSRSVIQQHLGHESFTTTVNTYGQLDRPLAQAAADAIGAALS